MLDINLFKNSGFFETRTLKVGEYLFKEGENDDNIYIIVTGELIIEKFTTKNRNETKNLALLGKNEVFGEASLSNNLPKQVSVKAKKMTQVIYINAIEGLDNFSKKFQKEAMGLLKYVIFLGNNRLNKSNSLITSSHEISKEIIKIDTFNSKTIFELIDTIKDIIDVSEIIYLEKNPVMDEYLTLKYKTSKKGILQDDVVKITDNKLYLLELKHSGKYNYMQDIIIGSKHYGYLIFLRENNDFSQNEIKIISSLSLSFGGLLKQKELIDEQKNKDYIKNS